MSGRPNRSQFSWALYDWANSAFATTVIAGFFPLFFKQYWSGDAAATDSTFWLGAGNSAASLLIVLAAPLLGALADTGGLHKRLLGGFALLGIVCTAGLYLVGAGEFYWFTPAAMQYAMPDRTVHDLPVDAHTLIALRAPHPLFVTTGLAEKGEAWVDPQGNWTSVALAQPAWELFGAATPREAMPVPQSTEQASYPLGWYQHGEGHVAWPAFEAFIAHAERFFED